MVQTVRQHAQCGRSQTAYVSAAWLPCRISGQKPVSVRKALANPTETGPGYPAQYTFYQALQRRMPMTKPTKPTLVAQERREAFMGQRPLNGFFERISTAFKKTVIGRHIRVRPQSRCFR